MTDYSRSSDVKTETVENPNIVTFPTRKHNVIVDLEYPEFQCLCPVSNRHDQGIIRLRYEPHEYILESKSVRDYLMQWRNKHTWQEYVTHDIADALFQASKAKWLTIEISWCPRGGITAKTFTMRGEKKDKD